MEFDRELWFKQRTWAEEAFEIITRDTGPGTAYVQAQADTGSRYAALATLLPEAARRQEGGALLVSVIAPWSSAYPANSYGDLDVGYVWEHWVPMHHRNPGHGGDAYALWRVVNTVMSMVRVPV